jgi:hypothetical protein
MHANAGVGLKSALSVLCEYNELLLGLMKEKIDWQKMTREQANFLTLNNSFKDTHRAGRASMISSLQS